MKAYFIMIAGAAVLSALASVMSPEKWRKYTQLVTGIVILSCIISPVAVLIKSDNGFKIPEISSSERYDEDLHRDIVISELTARIEEDIEARMEREYGVKIRADVEIEVNGDNEIEGVTRISVTGGALTENAKRELCNIYGVDTVYEK